MTGKTHTITTPKLVVERYGDMSYRIILADRGTTIDNLDQRDIADLIMMLTVVGQLGEIK